MLAGSAPAAWKRRIRTRAGWSDAATYTMSDLTMLRKEMAVGFVVAGFLTVLVPTGAWNAIFIHGHGLATTLENVTLGPLVAILSFVCSIGNVPLAAALWKGGISFGGVVSFIFADLITLPLLLIYRKQYGRRMTLRILAVFWVVMALAGLITEELFKALGWVPGTRPAVIAATGVGLNYTTSSTSSPWSPSPSCTGCTATGTASAAARAMPGTRSAGCRSIAGRRPPPSATEPSSTTSARSAAGTGSPRSRRQARRLRQARPLRQVPARRVPLPRSTRPRRPAATGLRGSRPAGPRSRSGRPGP